MEHITVWIEYICQNRRKLIKVPNEKLCLVKDDRYCSKLEGKCSDNGKAIHDNPKKKSYLCVRFYGVKAMIAPCTGTAPIAFGYCADKAT